MKKLLSLLLIAIQLGIPFNALAALSEPDRALILGRNVLTNPGFESSTAAWAASGGVLTTTTTAANIGSGNASGAWDSSAASQTLTSGYQTVTSGDGYSGQNGVVSCRFKCASGTCTHTLTAFDGSSNLVTPATITSSASGFVRTSVNFIYPASGTVALRMSSVASNEPNLFIDGCYMGLAEGFNLSQVSQAQLIGTIFYPVTAGCDWVVTPTAGPNTFPAQSSCPTPTVTGQATTAAGKIPGGTFSNLGPGSYRAVIQSELAFSSSSTANNAAYSLTDGTSTQGSATAWAGQGGVSNVNSPNSVEGNFTYTTAQSSVTFQVQAKANSSSSNLTIVNSSVYRQTGFYLSLYYFPSQSQTALNSNQQANYASASFTSGTTNFNTTSASYVSATGANLWGARTFSGAGTACADGSALCVKFPQMPPGDYRVSAQTIGYTNGTGGSCVIEINDGADNDGNSLLFGQVADVPIPINFVKNYSLADREFVFKIKRTSGASSCYVDLNGTGGSFISITPANQSIPSPLLVGSVTSSSAGMERVERALATATCSASPCTLINSSPAVTNVTRTATGSYSVNFAAGTWSAAPTCTCIGISGNTICDGPTFSTSAFTFRTNQLNTIIDNGFSVICMGPR